ncbi:hypothetical protein IL306_000546 [Fusarium sp. DS 682]|nr:hypothetical protein IL306_000546 [Fusarium sp. DS 682]
MKAQHEVAEKNETRVKKVSNAELKHASLSKGRLKVIDVVQLRKWLTSIEDLVIARCHLCMPFIGLTNAWVSIYHVKLPPCDSGRNTSFHYRRVQHDCPLVQNELRHGLVIALAENLEADEAGDAVLGTQAIFAYNKDMAVDRRAVDLLNRCHLSPTASRLLKVRTEQDCVIRDFEVTVDEMNTKELVGIVPDEEVREVLDVLFLNNRLLSVVSEVVVPTKMLELVATRTRRCLAICGFSQSFGSSKPDPTMEERQV